MKHLFPFLLYAFLSSHFAVSQNKQAPIRMISEYSSENTEIKDLFIFENIDYYKLTFVGKELKGKYFSIVVKEYWDGELTRIDTLTNTAKYEQLKLSKKKLKVNVMGRRTPDKKLTLFFRFPWFGTIKSYDALESYDYSLKVIGTKMNIVPNESFYMMAYILPYVEGGSKHWCTVDDSGKDVENWGKEFGIEHYLTFEMKFE